MRADKRLSDKRPANIYRRRRDAAGFPAACSPVDRGFGEDLLIAMIQVAAQIAGKADFLTPGRDLPQVPLGPGEGALRVLSFASGDGTTVQLQLALAPQPRVRPPTANLLHRKEQV